MCSHLLFNILRARLVRYRKWQQSIALLIRIILLSSSLPALISLFEELVLYLNLWLGNDAISSIATAQVLVVPGPLIEFHNNGWQVSSNVRRIVLFRGLAVWTLSRCRCLILKLHRIWSPRSTILIDLAFL